MYLYKLGLYNERSRYVSRLHIDYRIQLYHWPVMCRFDGNYHHDYYH